VSDPRRFVDSGTAQVQSEDICFWWLIYLSWYNADRQHRPSLESMRLLKLLRFMRFLKFDGRFAEAQVAEVRLRAARLIEMMRSLQQQRPLHTCGRQPMTLQVSSCHISKSARSPPKIASRFEASKDADRILVRGITAQLAGMCNATSRSGATAKGT
jgi:hypothetical protein